MIYRTRKIIGVGVVVILGALSLIAACYDTLRERPKSSSLADRDVSEAATLDSLAIPSFSTMQNALDAFELHTHLTLTTSSAAGASSRSNRVEQAGVVVYDLDGGFSARKDIVPRFGAEAIWDGKYLFQRLRYARFTRRQFDSSDLAQEIVEKKYSLLIPYVEFFSRSMVTRPGLGSKIVAGRSVRGYRLEPRKRLADDIPPNDRVFPVARRWRRGARLKEGKGSFWIDVKTGIPLEVTLDALYSVPLPGDDLKRPTGGTTGIPQVDGRELRGTIRIRLRYEMVHVGAHVAKVQTPAAENVIKNTRVWRSDLERQMVVGERRLRVNVLNPDLNR